MVKLQQHASCVVGVVAAQFMLPRRLHDQSSNILSLKPVQPDICCFPSISVMELTVLLLLTSSSSETVALDAESFTAHIAGKSVSLMASDPAGGERAGLGDKYAGKEDFGTWSG
jgi:hypothetical protein